MKTGIKVFICLAALLVGAVFVFPGCVIRGGVSNFGTYEDAASYQIGDFEYESADISSVEINWVSEDIQVVQVSGSGKLKVSEEGNGLEDAQKLHWLIKEGKLTIQYCASGFHGRFPARGKKLTVEIPENITLVIASVSGAVKGNGSLVCRDLTINSVSGKVDIGKVSASGSVEIDTVSGSVSIGITDGKSLSINTVSGDATLTAVPEGGAAITFESMSGNVKGADISGRSGQATIGDGECKITVATVSGNLNIKK